MTAATHHARWTRRVRGTVIDTGAAYAAIARGGAPDDEAAYAGAMAGIVEGVALWVVMAVVPAVILATMVGKPLAWRGWRLLTRRRRHSVPAEPASRPWEQIAVDARRLSERYHQEGMRFAQYEGRRQAFDRILAEAAAALQIHHLLDVLEPGPELDHERARLEAALAEFGVLPRRVGP